MTITPPRAAGGTTRTARNRTRRRQQNAAGEPRHAAVNQTELAPPRRRAGGRHAAEEPVPGSVAGLGITDADLSAAGFTEVPGFTDVAFPAPAWDPWAINAAGPVRSSAVPTDDLLEGSGEVAGRVFPAEADRTGRVFPAEADRTGRVFPAETDRTGRAFPAEADRAGRAFPAETDGIGRPVDRTGTSRVRRPASRTRADRADVDGAGRPGQRTGGRARRAYLGAAVLRCGLYLGPLSVAVASAAPLGHVAWPVPAVTLLLGWTAAQGLTSLGVGAARRGGPAAAARLVAAGFAAVIGLWCALVWIAPDSLLGPNRALAATVGAGGLLTLAGVTAALVTRAEGVIAGWYVPCWLLAAAVLAEAGGVAEAALVPVETLLPAVIVAATIRAFRPAVVYTPAGRGTRITAADRRRGAAYMIIGAAQAICVTLLWWGGPAVMPLPAALPLLLAVPLLEGLIGWHTARLDAGLDSAETPAELDRHVRHVTAITLAGLLPPLAAGGGLLVAAYRLPSGFDTVPGARDAVLTLAAGTLLSGVFAVTFLLAARSRHGIAAALAAIPPVATAVLAVTASPTGLLPAAVAVLAATHLAGLLIVALIAADLRRTP